MRASVVIKNIGKNMGFVAESETNNGKYFLIQSMLLQNTC